MKLEVGMYVRHKPLLSSKYVKINKIKEIEEKENCLHIWLEDKDLITEKYLIKASNNIIDLIEVGDYINGCYVSNKRASVNKHLGGHPKGIGIIKCNAYFNQGNYDDCKFEWIEEKDIKSIVTKEQFESIKYSLEG